MGSGHNGGGPDHKLNTQAVIAALDACGGIKTAASEMLGVARSTLYLFINNNPEVKATIREIDEKVLDVAEGKMLEALKAGDSQMIRWFLETKAKNRGFSRRHEVTGLGGDPIKFETATIDVSKMSTEALREIQAASVAAEDHDGQSD